MKPISLLEQSYGTSPILVPEVQVEREAYLPPFSKPIKEFLAYRASLGFNL